MTNNTSGEWLAPVTPLHRVSFTEVVDTVDDVPELDHDSEEPADEVDAQTIAIRALARRAMSIREMERLLRDRGASADEVANEVARLESVGLLNDDDLALDLAERLQTRKGMGASAIKSTGDRRADIAIADGLDPGPSTADLRDQALVAGPVHADDHQLVDAQAQALGKNFQVFGG